LSFANGTAEKSGTQKTFSSFLNIGPIKAVATLFKDHVNPTFEKQYPNISVNMVETDWDSAFQKVTTGIAAGTASDVGGAHGP
jgi:ABC-type glycerol-3-phosphate transport system substrate-binding protein